MVIGFFYGIDHPLCVNEDKLQQIGWSSKTKATTEDAVEALDFPPEWMEHLDQLLWSHEVVNIRLNKAVSKKKLAKQLKSQEKKLTLDDIEEYNKRLSAGSSRSGSEQI